MKNLMGVLANGCEHARDRHYAVCVRYIGEHLKEGAGDRRCRSVHVVSPLVTWLCLTCPICQCW